LPERFILVELPLRGFDGSTSWSNRTGKPVLGVNTGPYTFNRSDERRTAACATPESALFWNIRFHTSRRRLLEQAWRVAFPR
jgi:hypothetical protein